MTTLKETIIPEKRVRRITVLISGSGSNLQALLDASSTPLLPNAQITTVISSRSNAYGLIRAKEFNKNIETKICALKTFQNKNPGSNRKDYDCEIARLIINSKPDLVVLAGWMHILSDRFLEITNGEKEPPNAPALPPPNTTEELPSLDKLSISNSIKETPTTSTTTSTAKEKKDDKSESNSTPLPTPPSTQSFPIPIINLHPALPGAFDGANAIGRAFDAFQNGEIENTGVMVHRVVAEVDRGEPLIVRKVEIKKDDKLEDLERRIHEVEHQIIVEGAKLILEELDKEGR